MSMDEKIQKLYDTLDRVWGITWKTLTALAGIVILGIGWNITMLARQAELSSQISETSAIVRTLKERQETNNDRLIVTLDRLEQRLSQIPTSPQKEGR